MTARGDGRRHQVLAALSAVAFVVLVGIVVTAKREAPPRRPVPSPDARDLETPGVTGDLLPPATEPPPEAPTPTPAAGHAAFVVPWSAEPTPPPTAEPPPMPVPRATRAPQPCVEYTWGYSDSPAVIGQVLVEIRVRNRCGRVLQALEVMFRAEGIRGGDVIYSGQGNLLEKIYPDSVRTVMVALPGSASFFDTVEVTPINPPTDPAR